MYKPWVVKEELAYDPDGAYQGKKVHLKVAGIDNDTARMMEVLAEKLREIGGWVNKLHMRSVRDFCDHCSWIDKEPLGRVWIDAVVIVPADSDVSYRDV